MDSNSEDKDMHLVRIVVHVGGVVLLMVILVFAGVVSGQALRPTATLDDLLAEVRGLRAEMNEVGGATIRAQMLATRLSLQERRIGIVADQLAEARRARLAGDADHRARAAHLRGVEDSVRNGTAPSTQIREFETMLTQLREGIARSEQEQQAFRAHEQELRDRLSMEQNLWIDLSSRLDALEREPTTRSAR